jgi:hypothetical protein
MKIMYLADKTKDSMRLFSKFATNNMLCEKIIELISCINKKCFIFFGFKCIISTNN